MPKYSARSNERLDTCVEPLQMIFRELVKEYDNTVVCGYRTIADQHKAYNSNNSKVKYGKHNESPSEAIDIIPYPTYWDDINQFYIMAGHIKSIATRLDIKLRWGGDWDSDGDLTDQTFIDLGHWEYIGLL